MAQEIVLGKKKHHSRSWGIGLAFLLPGVFFTLLFRYYPMAQAFFMSAFEWDVATPPGVLIGLENFVNILRQAVFWKAVTNTFLFVALTFLLTFWVPILQALLLDQIKSRKVTGFVTTMYLLPSVIPISISVIIWKWIWNPDFGLANSLVTFLGGTGQKWLADPALTIFCIVFPGIIGGGILTLLYLAALKSIPEEVIESATLEGCTGWTLIRTIKLPNIRFVIVVQVIITVIGTMQILDAPFQYTQGGPNHAAESLGVFIYNQAFAEYSLGRSAAAAVFLFLFVVALTALQLKLNKEEKE